MKYAIIAAGEGSRLEAEGVDAPKPLVRLGGEHLLDRLIRIFMENDADDICVICNDRTTLVSRHLVDIQNQGLMGRPVPLRFKVKSTPSSMHSFYELSEWLRVGPFVLTTVDTVFHEKEFSQYVKAFSKALKDGLDGLMGVTAFVDDESPLWVKANSDMQIEGFYDINNVGAQFVSGGIYGLTERSLGVLQQCVKRGESRMRNFQRALISNNMRLCAFPFDKIIDIDHASDITKAEQFLSCR